MKQIIQDLKNGNTTLQEVPVPKVNHGEVLIKTTKSLVSLGTERMLVEFGKSSFIEKAYKQPEKVKIVKDKIETDGFMTTISAVKNKLDAPIPLGYCNVGKVVAIGSGVTDFNIGDRVASNGNHAEYVCITQNLIEHIPSSVTDEEAAFTVVGSIGLQGIRLVKPEMGETIIVIGLGLIGLITVQLLAANGCRVIGIDIDQNKTALAAKWNIEKVDLSRGLDPVKQVMEITKNIGADAVIITASSKSNNIITQAANMCRKRGRIVLIGVIGLNLNRSDFYEKELSFQVSCSYGPGRYDYRYEQQNIDYPLPYVRWTVKRNFQTILQALQQKTLHVDELISEVVDLSLYNNIYSCMGTQGKIASILNYSSEGPIKRNIQLFDRSFKASSGILGIVGAGNYTQMTMLPILKKINAPIKYIASSKGLTGTILAKKYQITNSTTDFENVLDDKDLDTILIATRHNLHAEMVIQSLNAGKNVFVEKPLALTRLELAAVSSAYEKAKRHLTVGFNRRFAPFSNEIKNLVGSGTPLTVVATMNAGKIPEDSWVHDINIGGGRIIGEACHFIDLISYFTGTKIISVFMAGLGSSPKSSCDNGIITLKYSDGSLGVINYLATGSKAYSKERIEVFSQGRTFIIENWRKLRVYGMNNSAIKTSRIDKGHLKQFKQLNEFIRKGGESPISFDSIMNTSIASIAAIESLISGELIEI